MSSQDHLYLDPVIIVPLPNSRPPPRRQIMPTSPARHPEKRIQGLRIGAGSRLSFTAPVRETIPLVASKRIVKLI